MTTLTCRLQLEKEFPGMSSRPMGDAALAQAHVALGDCETLEVDFGGIVPTPSFADQFIGGLAAELGLAEFRRRVKILNAPDAVQPLLRHVILKSAVGPLAVSPLNRRHQE